jgi:hypothetical protein
MRYSTERRRLLSDAAAIAYQRARVEVYDLMEPGEPLELAQLTPLQRIALDDLSFAEIELAEFRAQCHAPLEIVR